jgi:uncharacterized membrane protein
MNRDREPGAIGDRDIAKDPEQDAGNPGSLSAQVSSNIRSIAEFHDREHGKLSDSDRRIDRVGDVIGRPLYLAGLLSLVLLWIGGNLLARHLGATPFEQPPFSALQGVLTFAALLTTTVVLIAQNRLARTETQRSQLDLQVNLLTEQKVTKLIHLLEELRRDLPMVKNRHDPEAAALQQRTDTAQVLVALENVGAERPTTSA